MTRSTQFAHNSRILERSFVKFIILVKKTIFTPRSRQSVTIISLIPSHPDYISSKLSPFPKGNSIVL